jgi:hypothetical protein
MLAFLPMTRKHKQTIATAILILGTLASLPFIITAEDRRISSPDGRFYAVAACPIWQYCVPMAPGGGGDKSGYVTVFTREGKSCGRVPIDMVWMIGEMQWNATTAVLPLVAEWDLAKQTVKYSR